MQNRGKLNGEVNFDDIREQGIYNLQATSGTTSPGDHGVLEVFFTPNSQIVQRFTVIGSAPVVKIRTRTSSGIWTNWVTI